MIAIDSYYCGTEGEYAPVTWSGPMTLVLCPYCGTNSYCGTGHQTPHYRRSRQWPAPSSVYIPGNAPEPAPPKMHHFRAHAIGRRYIPVALDLAALPLVVVDKPWTRPFTPMRPVRTRRAARARAIAPLRSRPGRRRRLKLR